MKKGLNALKLNNIYSCVDKAIAHKRILVILVIFGPDIVFFGNTSFDISIPVEHIGETWQRIATTTEILALY